MSLDLTGLSLGAAQAIPNLNPQHDIMAGNQDAVLYVNRPFSNQFRDVAIRPFGYRFDDNFLGEVQELNQLAKTGQARDSSGFVDLRERRNLNDYMTVPTHPTMILNASQLSDRWRFVLILTDSTRGLATSHTMLGPVGSPSKTRRIYTGYFEDEPLNPVTRTPNPNAWMVITHKTIVGTENRPGAFGNDFRLINRASEEIVHPAYNRALMTPFMKGQADNRTYLMTPDNLEAAIEVGRDGLSTVVPGAHLDITYDSANSRFSDVLEQPMHNIGHVIKGMVRFQNESLRRDSLSHYNIERMMEDPSSDEHRMRKNLNKYMEFPLSKPLSPLDLDVNDRISVDKLDAMVGGRLGVQEMGIARPLYHETTNAMEGSMANQYASMIASVIPPLLNSAGLSSMRFHYEAAHRMGGPVEQFIVDGLSSCFEAPDDTKLRLGTAVEVELRHGIFKTIWESVGDFALVADVHTTGITTVQLCLVGQGQSDWTIFEVPTCLGGLVSPLVGDLSTVTWNSNQMELLFGIATGTQAASQHPTEEMIDYQAFANSITADLR